MKTAVRICACIALLALSVLFMIVAAEVNGLQVKALHEIDIQGAATRELIAEQAALLMKTSDSRLASIQEDLRTQIAKTRTAAVEQIALGRADLMTQISLTRATLDSQTSKANESLARAVAGTETVSASTAKVMDQINAGLPLYLDCDAGECFANKFYGMAQSFEKLSASSAKVADVMANEAPATAAAVRGIAVDVHRETDEFVKPKRWYQKLLAPVLVGGRIAAAFL